jgi:hypothetical protein
MNSRLRLSYLGWILLVSCGVILQLALEGRGDRTFTYQEAYSRILKDGVTFTPSLHNVVSMLGFLMLVAGLAGIGFTSARALESKAPHLGKIVQIMVLGVTILYFGAALFFMLSG